MGISIKLIEICAVAGILVLLTSQCLAGKYCTTNDDCKSYGELVCVKSRCETGVCQCNPRYAARFFGDMGKFKCVPLRKIGEKCSPDGLKGLCGVPDSLCNTDRGRCECKNNYIPSNGMERCITTTATLMVGEYCNKDNGACDTSSINTAIDSYAPPHRSCGVGQHMVIMNKLSKEYFLASSYTACQDNRVGDACRKDVDCANIQESDPTSGTDKAIVGGVCDTTTKKCKCKTASRVVRFDGLYCGTALAQGDKCSGTANSWDAANKVRKLCDGSKGLVCGDPCKFEADATCQCAVTYAGTSTCSERKEGDTCYGNENCKGIAETAVCEDGKCKAVPSFQTDSGARNSRPFMTAIAFGMMIAMNLIKF